MTTSIVSIQKIVLISCVVSVFLVAGTTRAATYQAENYTNVSGCKVDKSHAGYTGVGFVDMGGKDSWFESNLIDGGLGGTHTLTYHYASRDTINRRCEIVINGVSVGKIEFKPTVSWTSWSTGTIDVNLKRGLNRIQLKASTTRGGPNVDKIEVTRNQTHFDDMPEAVGDLNFAVVALDYANDGSAASVYSLIEGMFDGEYSVANFLAAASYGKTTLTGDVFGWIIPSKPLWGSGWTDCWPSEQDQFNLLLENYPLVDLHNYDGFIFYINRPADSNCQYFGVSNTVGIEAKETYTSFGVIDTRISFFSTDFYFPYQAYSRITDSTAAHEIIHSLGINGHSLAYNCGDQVLSTDYTDCDVQEYGDIFSIMGLRSQASLPDVITSERLGWMDSAMIMTLDEGGRYTINSLEDQTENIKAIKIPLDRPINIDSYSTIDHLYIEYRGMTGFDERSAWFRKISLQNGSEIALRNIHGALIHGADCSTNEYCVPYLLNMHPNSVDAAYTPNKVAQAYLYEGESFEVPLNNIKISVIKVAPEDSLTIEVEYKKAQKEVECPSDVVIRAIPAQGSSPSINWSIGASRMNLSHPSFLEGCDACVYSTSRIIYNIALKKSIECPKKIFVEAQAINGGLLEDWENSNSGPIPLVDSILTSDLKYCSYRQNNFSHKIYQCR